MAILDGNVKRVLCRVFGVEGFPGEKAVETRLWTLAESLLPEHGIGRYIQAQMDLGATLCTRARPACARCPFHDDCVARRDGRVAELPAARPKKAVPRRGARCAVIVHQGAVLLERRPPAGIWGGLLALPRVARRGGRRAGLERAALRPRHRRTRSRSLRSPTPSPTSCSSCNRCCCRPPTRSTASADDGALCWLPLGAHAEAALPTPVRRILDELARPDLFGEGMAAPRSI